MAHDVFVSRKFQKDNLRDTILVELIDKYNEYNILKEIYKTVPDNVIPFKDLLKKLLLESQIVFLSKLLTT